MKIRYDREVDALSIIFTETTVTTEEVAEGIAVEYDAEGQLAGIEILDARRKLGPTDPFHSVTFEGLAPTATAR